jgi:hypothetical protein
MKRIVLVLALLAASAAAAHSAAAQDLSYRYRTAGYWGLGFGGGNFKLSCDSGCVGSQLGSSGALLGIGFHVSPRVRIELAAQYLNNTVESSNAFAGSAGAAVYLAGNLFVRGAATYLKANVEDSLGSGDGSGGPGFLVGAGYDLRLGRVFALTPYATFTTGSISKITRTAVGGGMYATRGTLRTLNIGVALSFMRGAWECTTARGERVMVTPRHRARALACLQEFVSRGGQRPSSLKY